MLKTIDRYILSQFLKTYVFVIIGFILIVMVIDFTEKNGDFIEHQLSWSVIGGYYLNMIPYMMNLMSPLLTFIAVVFVTARMALRTEIIAIFGSGTSLLRMSRPFMIGSFIITLLNLYLNFFIIPTATKEKVEFENTYVEAKFYYKNENIHMQENDSTLVYMQRYSNTTKTGTYFTIEKIDGNELKAIMYADKIKWDEEKGKWKLINWRLRELKKEGERYTKGVERDTLLRFLPKDFETQHNMWETLTLPALDEKINDMKERGIPGREKYVVEKYVKFMGPWATIILTFIGLVVSSRKTRNGAGGLIAAGFVLAFSFIVFFMLTRSMAQGSEYPILVIWTPNILYSFLGFVLYKTLPR